MASLLSHPAAPLAMLLARGERLGGRLGVLCILLSVLPDADVIGFAFGIPYGSQWGHRGFTHSLVFAVIVGFLCTQFFSDRKRTVFLLTTLSTFSHPLSDMLTDGGLGVALWWPFDTGRYFFPWRPIAVSPIGIGNFIGMRGVHVVATEIAVLWAPLLLSAFLIKRLRR